MKKANLAASWDRRSLVGLLFATTLGCAYSVPLTVAEPPKPSGPRRVAFSGYKWRVKASDQMMGPRSNWFSDRSDNVWVDQRGHLHLKITKDPTAAADKWWAAEVIAEGKFGYGRYEFTIELDDARLDSHAIFGLFTWDPTLPEGGPLHSREIDIEFGRWGDPKRVPSHYAVPPYEAKGLTDSYFVNKFKTNEIVLRSHGNISTHVFEWHKDRIVFSSYYGEHTRDLTKRYQTWTFADKRYVQKPGEEEVRINLWLLQDPKFWEGFDPKGFEDETAKNREHARRRDAAAGHNKPYGDGVVEAIVRRFSFEPHQPVFAPVRTPRPAQARFRRSDR